MADRLLLGLTPPDADATGTVDYSIYRDHPVAYARNVLKVVWWKKQREVARSFAQNARTLVLASHSVGKSHLMGGLVNWAYDCWDPGITIASAPTLESVKDIIFKEARAQRLGRGGFMPAAPRLESSSEHFAVGHTAKEGAGFQGRHAQSVKILFDEAVGIASEFWIAAEGMIVGPNDRWLGCMNPTDLGSQAYQESVSGAWNVITISVLDHPNIAAELAGRRAPFPEAVSLNWLLDKIARWCNPVPSALKKAGDFEFPPGSDLWHRPTSLFESKCLGRFPTGQTDSVWTVQQFEAALVWSPVPESPLEIGCDVARKGDDLTSIIPRRGRCALGLETYNGNGLVYTASRIKQAIKDNLRPGEDPKLVAIKIDDDGVGGGVTDILEADGYHVVPVNASTRAFDPDGYPNRRSELWFELAARADTLDLDLSRIPKELIDGKAGLRMQLLAPKWTLDVRGRRVVEEKIVFKKRLGRSPDDADALNLAFAPAPPKKPTQRSGYSPLPKAANAYVPR